MDRYSNSNDSTEEQSQANRPANPYINPGFNPNYQPDPTAAGANQDAQTYNPYYSANGGSNPYYQAPINSDGLPFSPYQNVSYPTDTRNQPNPPQTTKNSGLQIDERQRALLGERLRAKPVWTYVFLAVIGLVFLGQMMTGGSIDGNLDGLMLQGALIKSDVQQGEWWRLITPIFLHFGIMHILFNSMALYALGTQLEQLVGQIRYVSIFFVSGLGGSVLVLLLQSNQTITAGASGAVFGLMGALIGYFYRNRAVMGAWGAANLKNLLITAGLNFAFTLAIPGISLFGHLGGALAGLALGYLLSPLQVRRTGSQALALGPPNFLAVWWPVAAVLVVEGVMLFLALQSNQPVLRSR